MKYPIVMNGEKNPITLIQIELMIVAIRFKWLKFEEESSNPRYFYFRFI